MAALVRMALLREETDAALTLGVAGIIFASAVGLFLRGMIGGGDAKLMTAAVLLVGYRETGRFLMLMSLCGGALALFYVIRRRWAHELRPEYDAVQRSDDGEGPLVPPSETGIPYGLAISLAAITVLLYRM
jgi:prepilin peptidase CpaA